MDPLLINDSSFSAANLSSYSLADIWPPNSGLGLRVGSLGESGNHGESASVEASSATERISRGKKRKEAPVEVEGEDGSSRMGSAGGGTNSSKLSTKNAEIRGSWDEDDCTPRHEGQTDRAAARHRLSDQTTRPTEPPKDYIHVRARRGQATDSHSLAERARREKISERMRILQEIVPGCNKVIGKALILDRIINYIQSLQHQVEFLSMKIQAVNSRMNMNATVDGFHPKDVSRQNKLRHVKKILQKL